MQAKFDGTEGEKSEDDFTNFVSGLVGEHIDLATDEKLKEVKERYGEDNAETLSWMFQEREIDRILEQARG